MCQIALSEGHKETDSLYARHILCGERLYLLMVQEGTYPSLPTSGKSYSLLISIGFVSTQCPFSQYEPLVRIPRAD